MTDSVKTSSRRAGCGMVVRYQGGCWGKIPDFSGFAGM
jgi:hypothetical protein